MLLTHQELTTLVDEGMIDALKRGINGSSIDVHLSCNILVEARDPKWQSCIDIDKGETPRLEAREIESPYVLSPGQFVLASTQERFKLPNNITGFFCLRSTLARAGLQHSTSIGLKPGWEGNLTLEFSSSLKYHTLLLKAGMVVGDVYFFRHDHVNKQHLYRGKYQGISGVLGVVCGEKEEEVCYNRSAAS